MDAYAPKFTVMRNLLLLLGRAFTRQQLQVRDEDIIPAVCYDECSEFDLIAILLKYLNVFTACCKLTKARQRIHRSTENWEDCCVVCSGQFISS